VSHPTEWAALRQGARRRLTPCDDDDV